MKIPSATTLEQWGKWRENMSGAERAQSEIYSSVMGSGLAKAVHVVGDLKEWTTVRRGTVPTKDCENAVRRVHVPPPPGAAKGGWEIPNRVRQCSLLALTVFTGAIERFGHPVTDNQLDAILSHLESRVVKSLKNDSTLVRAFETVAKPYIQVRIDIKYPIASTAPWPAGG